MRNKRPPFEITNRMIDYVAEIAELLGKLNMAAVSYTHLDVYKRQQHTNQQAEPSHADA